MTRALGLVSGLVLAGAVHGEAKAATFTPDMWVYEVTLTATDLSLGYFNAFTDAEVGTTVPGDCSSSDNFDGTILIYCGSNPGIDLFATMDEPLQSRYLTRSGRIGFNQTQILCDGTLVGCPKDGANPVVSFPDDLLAFYFESIALDAVRGRLSFCAGFYTFSGACYDLRPGSVTVSAGETAEFLAGTWDYGFGGRWFDGMDPYVLYSGTGRLLSPASARPSPEVIPLPAPLLMLGSGLLALGAFGARRNARRGGGRSS